MADQCRVFELGDPEPGLDVLAVRDCDRALWHRVTGGWVCRKPDGPPAKWYAVLATAGPLMDATSEIAGARYLDEILDALPTPRYATFAQAQAAGFPDDQGYPTVSRRGMTQDGVPFCSYPATPGDCEDCNGTGTGGEDMDTCPECVQARTAILEGARRHYEALQRLILRDEIASQTREACNAFAAAMQLRCQPWSTYAWSRTAPEDSPPRWRWEPSPSSADSMQFREEAVHAICAGFRIPAEIIGIVQSRWEPSPPSTDLAWLDEAVPESAPPSVHQVLAEIEAQPLERSLNDSVALTMAIARGWIKIDRGGRLRRRRARLTELGKIELRRLRGA